MRKALMTQNGVEYVDFTPEEVTAREAEEAQAQADKTANDEANAGARLGYSLLLKGA